MEKKFTIFGLCCERKMKTKEGEKKEGKKKKKK